MPKLHWLKLKFTETDIPYPEFKERYSAPGERGKVLNPVLHNRKGK